MATALSESLSNFLQTPLLGYLVALFTGLLASMSPCVISTIPLAIGYVGGYSGGETKKTVLYALSFVLGQTVAFVGLGFLFQVLGSVLSSPWWTIGFGVIMIVMGLNIIGIIHIKLPVMSPKVSRNTGIVGGFILGAMMATVSTTCTTPALLSILSMGAVPGSAVKSTVLMVFYALGQSTFVMAAAILAGKLPGILQKSGWAKVGNILMKILGVVVIIYAAYMIYGVVIYL